MHDTLLPFTLYRIPDTNLGRNMAGLRWLMVASAIPNIYLGYFVAILYYLELV